MHFLTVVHSSFVPFPSSHELDARKAREAAAEIAKYSQSSALRPALPAHYDALPAIGTYIPPRELVKDVPREPRPSGRDWDDRGKDWDRDRSRRSERPRDRSRDMSPPRSGSRNGSYSRDRSRNARPYDRPPRDSQSRSSRHESQRDMESFWGP
jgi:hypothetical protein